MMVRPLTLIRYLPLLLSFILIKSFGKNKTSVSACNVSTCGGIEVKYPFWLVSDRQNDAPYCGYKGFGLYCLPSSIAHTPTDQLILQLDDNNYHVRSIDYTTKTMSLFDIELIANKTCPRPSHNLTLGDLPLSHSPLDLNLSFYFNCSHPPPPPPDSHILIHPVECLKSGEKTSYISVETNQEYDEKTDENFFEWFKICEQKVVAPVAMVKPLNWVDPLAVLAGAMSEEGFLLDWRNETESACSRCEASDGLCWVSNAIQKCFCHDGSVQPDSCDKGHGPNVRLKIGIGFGAAGGSIIIMCLIFFVYQRRQKKRDSGSTLLSREISSYPSSACDPEKGLSSHGVHIFEYSELEQATNNFDSERELGDGGFGTVYKGKLQDGRVVAVKRLYESNFKRVEQFRNEVLILTRLRHQNLVCLYGCTSRHCRELLLVYEYIPNGTIADHLHGELAKPGSLPWSTRMKIAIETASALTYLHASDVIHRDVKTNNILLDDHFCVKVADFGLSRLFPINATHISTAPQGTPGYVDPEYHQCYHLTDKSDVFSFGVVLIELISSMPAVDISRHRHEINLSNMAINKIQSRLLHELVDPNLGFESDYNTRMMITDVAELAFRCLQYERDMRPSMEEVLEALMQIQSSDYSTGNASERDIQEDDVKRLNLTSSPDSVMGWVSSTITPSASN